MRFDNSGWLAGGTIGVNAQVGRFVFGVEGEILATGIKDSFAWSTGAGPFSLSATFTSEIDWLAIAEEQHTAAAAQNFPAPISINYSGKAVHTGAVVGAGGECAFAPNWSVKAEYNYIKMLAQRVQLQGTAAGGPFGAGSAVDETASKVTQDLHLVKVGVNYHFNP